MPYPTILPQNQLANHIVNFWLGVNSAVLRLRDLGFDVYMPLDVPFDCLLIDEIQAVPILATTTGTDITTGTDSTASSGTTSDITNQTTSHGETINTIDNGQTEYASGDLQTGLQVMASGIFGADNYIAPPIPLPF